MAIPIIELRGMSLEPGAKMRDRGIYDSDQLLEAVRTPSGRRASPESVGVEPRVVLELANRADLARVRGIGSVFSDLLEQAGVDTVKELATRRPDNLHARLVETNTEKELAGRLPALDAVQDWVAQAKELPKLLEY